MSSYKIASEEGAQWYGGEIGQEVELDLDKDQERALIAAGWLKEHKGKKKEG
jgi:hypothetical protein